MDSGAAASRRLGTPTHASFGQEAGAHHPLTPAAVAAAEVAVKLAEDSASLAGRALIVTLPDTAAVAGGAVPDSGNASSDGGAVTGSNDEGGAVANGDSEEHQ